MGSAIKKLALVIGLLLMPSMASAQYIAVNLQCAQGGKALAVPTIMVPGLNTPTALVGSYPLATATVYQTGTTNKVAIYPAATGGTLNNPTSCDATGYLNFYIAAGTYDVTFSGNTQQLQLTTPFTISAISIGGSGGSGCVLGNCVNVIDLTTIANYQAIAATDLAALYAAGVTACGNTVPTCVIDGRGLTGSSYPWTTWQINRPLTAYFPAITATKSSDNLQPMLQINGMSTPFNGAVNLYGQGCFLNCSTVFYLSTAAEDNDILAYRGVASNPNLSPVNVHGIGFQGSFNRNVFGCGIIADAGMPNNQNPNINLDDIQVGSGGCAIDINTAYYNKWNNVRWAGDVWISGSNTTWINGYADNDTGSDNISLIASWMGQQPYANSPYVVGEYVLPRAYNIPYIYEVTTAGTTGSTFPTWPSSGTVTWGTAVFTEIDKYGWPWMAGTVYPANSCIKQHQYFFGQVESSIFCTVLGGTSDTVVPTWALTGDISDGTITDWVYSNSGTGSLVNPQAQSFVGTNINLENGGNNAVTISGYSQNTITFDELWAGGYRNAAIAVNREGGSPNIHIRNSYLFGPAASSTGAPYKGSGLIPGTATSSVVESSVFDGNGTGAYGVSTGGDNVACGVHFINVTFTGWATANVDPAIATSTCQGFPGPSIQIDPTIAAASGNVNASTPITFDLSHYNYAQFTCNTAGAAVTVSPITGLWQGGKFTLDFVQNGTTACTISSSPGGGAIHGFMTPSATLGSHNIQTCRLDPAGTAFYCDPANTGL